MSKMIGMIEPAEKAELNDIYEKRQALQNLLLIIEKSDTPSLFEQVENEIRELAGVYDQWWDKIDRKYGWEKGQVIINFATGEVSMAEQ